MEGPAGIEPALSDSKSDVLPLHQGPWQGRRDLNSQHADSESAALPVELLPKNALAERERIELSGPGGPTA